MANHYYDHYDRTGRPISAKDAAGLFREDRHVGSDHVGDYWISTVHLVVNHRLGDGPPLIFETMVFFQGAGGSWLDEYTERYSTEEQARNGHEHVVGMVRELVELGSA